MPSDQEDLVKSADGCVCQFARAGLQDGSRPALVRARGTSLRSLDPPAPDAPRRIPAAYRRQIAFGKRAVAFSHVLTTRASFTNERYVLTLLRHRQDLRRSGDGPWPRHTRTSIITH
ncbi:hypothetical protein KM043_013729 [Ampulex compressa]|nr:hypothetical protein KM043_013729 [Ampulex compressa]